MHACHTPFTTISCLAIKSAIKFAGPLWSWCMTDSNLCISLLLVPINRPMVVLWVQAIVSVTEHETGGGLLSIADLPPQCGGGQVGVTPLLHFLYKSPTHGQVIMPAFDAPLDRHDLQLVSTCPRSCQDCGCMTANFTYRTCVYLLISEATQDCTLPKTEQRHECLGTTLLHG